MTKMQGKVKLDVGGKLFSTTISSLTKYPDSMLGAMFSGRYEIMKNDDDCVFIDRDPKYFRYVLDFLRNDEIDFPTDVTEVKKINREMEYFGLKKVNGIGMEFVYVKDMDSNGVFSYCLKNNLPCTFEVTKDHGSIHEEISKVIDVNIDMVWQIANGLNAWFSIFFYQGLSFKPTKYTIRHRNEFNDTALRNWSLYGFINGGWDLIKSHVNDTGIEPRTLATFSWDLGCTDYYTGFKILHTGQSSGSYAHFNLSNIEFYGFLIGY